MLKDYDDKVRYTLTIAVAEVYSCEALIELDEADLATSASLCNT